MDFEWDNSKELENIRKHRVTFAEAVESFRDPRGIKLVDSLHQGASPGSTGWAVRDQAAY